MTIVRATSFGPLLRSCSKRPVPDPLELCTGMPALSNRSNVSCVILQAMGRLRSTIGLGVATLVLAGSAPASGSDAPPIGSHLTLTTRRAVAGQPIKGTVVLTNRTQHEITVDACAINRVVGGGSERSCQLLSIRQPPRSLRAVGSPRPRHQPLPGERRHNLRRLHPAAAGRNPSDGHTDMCHRGRPPGPSPLTRRAVFHKASPHRPHWPDAGSQPDRRHARGTGARPRTRAMCRNHHDGTDHGDGSQRHRGQLVGGGPRVCEGVPQCGLRGTPVGTRVVAESSPPNSKVAEYSTVTLGTR